LTLLIFQPTTQHLHPFVTNISLYRFIVVSPKDITTVNIPPKTLYFYRYLRLLHYHYNL